jgi:aminopeptidase N
MRPRCWPGNEDVTTRTAQDKNMTKESGMKARASIIWMLLASPLALAPGAQAADRIVLPKQVVPLHYDVAFTPNEAQMSFSGKARIDLQVLRPVPSIVLNAAELSFGQVLLDGGGKPATVSFDAAQQTATLRFGKPVSSGRHVLSIDYSGTINRHAAGLFALDYDTPQGKKQALFTQFENSDARRFLPCWDEPGRKATFSLTATLPADEMAVSNMPVDSSENLADGIKRVHFAQSPKMSSYLLFFASGDFERVSQMVDGVDVGVVVKRGDTAKAQYALDAAAHLLPYYEDYFGVKYPLPKLDLIAGPGLSQFFGAMENWGAIFYFESDLLIDPALSTQRDRRVIYTVVAHEMAHQWFGDLVTMAWWDDLWLNEGFASWMENKATDHFHPEWTLWLEAQNDKEAAMGLDSRRGTHPIIQHIRDVLQANEAFDGITYEKGAAVIRMLEDYVGEDRFRAGVRNYMKAHAYGNTVTDDLWRELDRTAATPVSPIAHDFTLQAGVPLLRVSTAVKGEQLTQDRFAVDDSGKQPAHWHLPVSARPLGAADTAAPWQEVLKPGHAAMIEAPSGALVNAGQAGYYRTLYTPQALPPLVAVYPSLSAADQLGLLNDARALGYSGYEPLPDFLELANQAASVSDPVVLLTLLRGLEDLDYHYQGLAGQALFRTHARRMLQPLYARIGWTAAADESQNTALLRAELLRALGQFDDAVVIGQARSLFAAYLHDPASLDGESRRTVLAIVADQADADTWEQLHVLAQHAPSSLEQSQLYSLLGRARSPELADRALQLTLADEVTLTTRPRIISGVAHYHPELAFDFVNAHLSQVMQMLEPDSRNEYVPRLAGNAHDAAMIAKLQAYAQAHIPASARQSVVKAVALIGFNVDVQQHRLPDLDRWLGQHAEALVAAPQ